MLSKPVFTKEMMIFGDMYKEDLSPEAIQRYYELLCHYTDAQFKTACMNIAKNRVYKSFPTIADIVNTIDGDLYAQANIEWGNILNSIRNGKGGYTNSKLCNNIINLMGNLREVLSADLPFKQKQFVDLYCSMKPKFETEMALPQNQKENIENKNNIAGLVSAIVNKE